MRKKDNLWSITRVIFACLLIVLLALSGCAKTADKKNAPDNTAQGQQTQTGSIKIVDSQGNLHTVDLKSLPQVKGTGIFKKSTGALVGPAEISGPKLTDVLKAAGVELTASDALEFVASDGYKITLDYKQATGNVMTYLQDGKNGTVKQLDVLLGIESSDQEVGEGMPRLCYVGEDNPISDGHLWVKLIDSINIKAGVADWTIKLSGYKDATIDRATYESSATCTETPHPAQKIEIKNSKGGADIYEGMGLWLMVAVVDGGEEVEGHYAVNRDIVRSGYTVKVLNKEGKSLEYTSIDVSYNEKIVLAYKKNTSILGEGESPLVLIDIQNADKPVMLTQVNEIQLLNLPQQ